MNRNLNVNISPTGQNSNVNVKKLSKMPMVIISIVLLSIILGLGYATVKRTEKSKMEKHKQETIRNDGESLASNFIAKLYQSRKIQEEQKKPQEIKKNATINRKTI